MDRPVRRCSICDDPVKRIFVAQCLDRGMTANAIRNAIVRTDGMVNVAYNTVRQHMNLCSTDISRPLPSKRGEGKPEDVAVLVQREVIAKLRAGEARVTVQHGLQAQALIDRREERAKDRELAITLARLLHTERPPEALISVRAEIEGEYEVVS